MAERRGTQVKFTNGKYVGYKGWIDNEGEETLKSVPVIIHKYPNSKGVLKDKATMVRKSSVMVMKDPSSYAEAALLQHAKISAMMDKLCDHLAMCEINPNDQNLMKIFAERLGKAVVKQAEKGDDALWYQVNYHGNDEA